MRKKPSPFVLTLLLFSLLPGHLQSQSCPITITHLEPRASVVSPPPTSVPPYLKILFQNNSVLAITRVVFEVHFLGAFGEFTATHSVPGHASDVSVWSDAAFVRQYGDAMDLEVRPDKVVWANGTTWLDDGSHLCSKVFAAAAQHPRVPSQTVVVRADSLAGIAVFPGNTQEADASPAPEQDQEAAGQAAKQPASLLVPPSGNAPVADESAPVQMARFSHVHSGPPLELDPIVLDIKELPLIQPRLLPLRGILLCPVVADYLDVGGAGRLYTSIRNKSDHTVESIVFTVRSGEARQTIRENVALVPGKHATAAWHADPPLPGDAETFLQVDKIVFADGNVWSDGGHGMCSVSASRQATDNTSQLASTLATAVQQPNPALPLIVQGPARTQGPATAPQGSIQPSPAAAIPQPGGPTTATVSATSNASVTEEATPEAMRRNAPLIAEKKASVCAITTTPPGATVSIDGKRLGESPLVFVLLRKDEVRHVTLSLPGYQTVEYQLWPDGSPVSLNIHFAASGERASVAQ